MKRNSILIAIALAVSAGAVFAKPPAPGVKLPAIPIVGKSGKFNVYKIEPKDDLDALKYFSGDVVYQPEQLYGLIPVIEVKDQTANGLTCEFLCADKAGNIVGRVRLPDDGKK